MPEISLIIPCYNEAARFDVSAFENFLLDHDQVVFCFVNDGSKDGTAQLLNDLSKRYSGSVLVKHLEKNCGKAEAVRLGMMDCFQKNTSAFIGFWDADLSTPLNELDRLKARMDSNPQCMMAVGSRLKRMGAEIERRPVRHIMGRIFSTFASMILGLPVYDSQCGAKLFRKESIKILFEEKFITRWLFDLELFARLRNHFGRDLVSGHIEEVPVLRWKDVAGSKIGWMDFIKVPVQLWKIHKAYN